MTESRFLIVESVAELRTRRRALNGTVGFVPTMGYLHAGHLALVAQAARENDHVIVSIFVNPTQFGPNEDFSRYPRNTERDLALLRDSAVDLIFMPPVAAIYPPGFQTAIEVSEVSQGLEGGRRPGHFRGVATVVCKLFNLVQPDRAYFGQKDAQQVAVIRQMAIDLDFPLDVVIAPTKRAPDGLALSSRNTYLTLVEREAAPVLYRALLGAALAYHEGQRDSETLRQIMLEALAAEPMVAVDYVSVADAGTLREQEGELTRRTLFSLAVRIGKTRLIDNLVLEAVAPKTG